MYIEVKFFIWIIIIILAGSLTSSADRQKSPGLRRRKGNSTLIAHPSKITQFPYLVTVVVASSSFCHGVILNKQWILTVASRIKSKLHRPTVVVGEHNLNRKDQNDLEIPVVKILRHENYTSNLEKIDNNIALLKLRRPLIFNEYIKPIRVPNPAAVIPKGYATMASWGLIATDRGQTIDPVVPHYVKLSIIGLNTCRNAWKNLTRHLKLTIRLSDNVICTKSNLNDNACGDNGAPLITLNENKKLEITGIMSWPTCACLLDGMPVVYTRISAYADWIGNVIDQDRINMTIRRRMKNAQ